MLSAIDQYIIQQVREKRKERGFSQSKLAFELEVTNGYVGKIESGKYGKKYNPTQLNEIAKILQCSPKDFMPDAPF